MFSRIQFTGSPASLIVIALAFSWLTTEPTHAGNGTGLRSEESIKQFCRLAGSYTSFINPESDKLIQAIEDLV